MQPVEPITVLNGTGGNSATIRPSQVNTATVDKINKALAYTGSDIQEGSSSAAITFRFTEPVWYCFSEMKKNKNHFI